MSSDRRWVPIPVDDPRVTHLAIEHQDDTMLGTGGEWPDLVKAERVPVPPDDRLEKAIRSLVRLAEVHYAQAIYGAQREMLREYKEAAAAARAAFQLGEEE